MNSKMKLKEKLLNLLKVLRKSVEKFPMTMISIFVLTLIYTVCIGNGRVDWGIIGRITLCIVIFLSTSFLIETLVKEKKKSIIIYYILAIIWASGLTILVFVKDDILGISNELFVHYIIRVIVCYLLCISILSLYFNYKKSEKTFENYLTSVVISIFKTTVIYVILAIGSDLVVSIFIFLILNGRGYILLGRVEILLLGLYYLPTIIYSFYKQNNEIGKFAKIIIKYVLGSLVMIAFVIIYIYMLKLLILRTIPSNQIFRIIATLFVIGLPIWTMCMSLDDGNTFDKINKKLPYLFAPFILLQIYSIGVRIASNGLTEARYVCIMLIIFEIIYTIIYLKNKSKIGINLLVAMALIIISTIAPFVNMFELSAISQFNILKEYDQKESITTAEKSKMRGAYNYLKNSAVGEKYLKNYTLKNKIDNFSEYEDNTENEVTIDVHRNANYINVDGYEKLYKISANMYSSIAGYGDNDNETIDSIFKNISFEMEKTDKTLDVNMLDLVKEYIKLGRSLDSKFDDVSEITVDNNRKIILNSVYIRYDKTTSKVNSYNIGGYLLEK